MRSVCSLNVSAHVDDADSFHLQTTSTEHMTLILTIPWSTFSLDLLTFTTLLNDNRKIATISSCRDTRSCTSTTTFDANLPWFRSSRKLSTTWRDLSTCSVRGLACVQLSLCASTDSTVGLTHLALPYYEKTLELSVQHQPSSSEPDRENFTREAAYNLQNLYVTTGNLEKARQVTERHLVI